MAQPLTFFAPGVPSTKGSARGFVVAGRGGGKPRAVITNDAGPKAKAWAAIVASAAQDAMAGAAPIEGAVSVEVIFEMPRPKAHSTKRGLRPDAPVFSKSKPDIDKLLRCFLDALTGVVFLDDAQIACLVSSKGYADGGCGARCRVTEIANVRPVLTGLAIEPNARRA